MDRAVVELYDEYTHAPLDRRVFLNRLSALVGLGAVPSVLAMLEPNEAVAQTIAEDDPRLHAVRQAVPGPDGGVVEGYLVRPRGEGRAPAVIVIHENRGLNAHIRDVARRFAAEGFLAYAPDLLTRLGGTPADQDQAREMIGRLDLADTLAELRAIAAFLRADGRSTGKVGAVGFCWGGGMVNDLAVAEPALDAGVVFYGRSPDSADVPRIQAPLLLHYGGLDERINRGVPAFEEALKAAGKNYRLHMYEGAHHAFHNDTSAERYDAEAAALAWRRTVAFFRETLGG